MADEHLERLESFKAFIQAIGEGSPVTPVNSDDLRRLHEMCEYVAKRHPDSARAISVAFIASVCGPGANLPAVWFRYARLRSLANRVDSQSGSTAQFWMMSCTKLLRRFP